MAKLIFYKGDEGGCGIHRIIQPAEILSDLGFDVSVEWLNTHRTIAADTAVCVFQRDYQQIDVSVYWKWLKEKGIKIVYDLDDDIFDVPKSNPTYSYFRRKDIREQYEYYLRNADVVTVSTEYLKNRLQEYNPNIIVVPNIIDLSRWKNTKKRPNKELRIGWAGSPTHEDDLQIVYPILKQLLQQNKQISLYFLGYIPPEFKKLGDRVHYISGGDYNHFVKNLQNMNLDIALAPLVVNNLNKAKSNIKYLEYSVAHLPTVASSISPYSSVIEEGKNGLLAGTVADWRRKIELLINNPNLRSKIAANAYQTVVEGFTSDLIKDTLKQLYTNLLKDFVPTGSITEQHHKTDDKVYFKQDLENFHQVVKMFLKNRRVAYIHRPEVGECLDNCINNLYKHFHIFTDDPNLKRLRAKYKQSKIKVEVGRISENYDLIIDPIVSLSVLSLYKQHLENHAKLLVGFYGNSTETSEFNAKVHKQFTVLHTINFSNHFDLEKSLTLYLLGI